MPEPKNQEDAKQIFDALIKEKTAAGLDADTAARVARDQMAWDASPEKARIEKEEAARLKRAAKAAE